MWSIWYPAFIPCYLLAPKTLVLKENPLYSFSLASYNKYLKKAIHVFDDNPLIYGHTNNTVKRVPPKHFLDKILVLPSYGIEIELFVLQRNAFEK